jgi:late competence protein required for DNA uptake (superfamily II DNA/RNA helicase)
MKMKYTLIDPENKHLLELKEFGDEIILEICGMFPEEVSRHFALIDKALEKNKLSELLHSFHTTRRNFEYFIIRTLPQYQMMINFENGLHELIRKQRNNEEVSLSSAQLEEIESFRQFADEVLEEVEIYTRELREELGN